MSDLHQRFIQAGAPTREAPIERIRHRVRRRRRGRRAIMAAAAVVVLFGGFVAVVSLGSDDDIRVGTTGGEVEIPDVTGLTLAEARRVLEDAGLEGRVSAGHVDRGGERVEWSDPDHPDAVVASQEPPAGPQVVVPRGSVVGLRTGLVNEQLCSVFSRVPPRRGNARDLAASPGFVDMLRDARNHADPGLAAAIDELLDHRDAGGTSAIAPSLALSKVTTHHDACAVSAENEFDFEGAIGPVGPWKANHDKLVDQGGRADVHAFELGAWFALADHCRNTLQPRDSCYREAAEFVGETLGSDPRGIAFSPRLARGEALAGAVGAAYDITRNTLGLNVQEPVDRALLFDERPPPWD